MQRVPYISKSKFMAGRQCPKREYLMIHEPSLGDTRVSDIQKQGTLVGELARSAFPGGVLIEQDNYNFEAAIAETERRMADPNVFMLFEAAFCYQNLRVRVDVLARMGEGWSIGTLPDQDYLASEVKASTRVKDHQIEDVSFQVYVLEKCGVKVRAAAIMHLNREYVYPGGVIDTTKLFKMEPITSKDAAWVEAEVARQLPVIQQSQPPVIGIGPHCRTPYECEFHTHCHPKVELAALPAPRPEGGFLLQSLRYPLFYLDFETLTPAIPQFPRTRAWDQVPTQWSCHIQRAPGGPLEHREFLHDTASDPRVPFAKAVSDVLEETGSVIIYSKFERTILRQITQQFPEFAAKFVMVETRLWDLYDLMKACFDKEDFGGSLSIKVVSKVLAPDVRYDVLAIRNGDEAAGAWRRLISLVEGPEKDQLRRDLAAYCSVDTQAMVAVLAAIIPRLAERSPNPVASKGRISVAEKSALVEIFEELQKKHFSLDSGAVRKVREQAEEVIGGTASRFGLQGFDYPPVPAPKRGWKKHNRTSAWKKAIKEHEKGVRLLPDGFVREPFGTQASPDYIFIFAKQLIRLDIKSSKDGRPSLNDNLPERGTIFVFASSQRARFTFALGSDLVSETMCGLIPEYWAKLRKLGEDMNVRLPEGEPAKFSWRKCFTFRPNPFIDTILGLDRDAREKRVLQRLTSIGSNFTPIS
jgi:hypothetical protein